MTDLIRVPAREGKAQALAQNESIRIVNTHGSQVVDTWAVSYTHLTLPTIQPV